jgi:hypothetical protein
VNDFTEFILVERYRSAIRNYRSAHEELCHFVDEKFKVEQHPKATSEDIEWARQRVGKAQNEAANALKAMYSLPPLGYKVEP